MGYYHITIDKYSQVVKATTVVLWRWSFHHQYICRNISVTTFLPKEKYFLPIAG
jgi:hypothetical protein